MTPAGDSTPKPAAQPGTPTQGPAATPEVVTLPLARLKVGQCGTIQEKRIPEQDRAMLRAMGLACNASITLCRQGEPCIVAITTGGAAGGRLGEASGASCRIGLTRELSEKIFVSLNQPR